MLEDLDDKIQKLLNLVVSFKKEGKDMKTVSPLLEKLKEKFILLLNEKQLKIVNDEQDLKKISEKTKEIRKIKEKIKDFFEYIHQYGAKDLEQIGKHLLQTIKDLDQKL